MKLAQDIQWKLFIRSLTKLVSGHDSHNWWSPGDFCWHLHIWGFQNQRYRAYHDIWAVLRPHVGGAEICDQWDVRQVGPGEQWGNVDTGPGLMRQDKATCCVNRPQCLLKSTIILKPWDLDSHHQKSLGSEGYYKFSILRGLWDGFCHARFLSGPLLCVLCLCIMFI